MSKILRCTCENKFQDKTYGKKMRVHNRMKDDSAGRPQFRCTVCEKERSIEKEK